jgi:hypothetical protein
VIAAGWGKVGTAGVGESRGWLLEALETRPTQLRCSAGWLAGGSTGTGRNTNVGEGGGLGRLSLFRNVGASLPGGPGGSRERVWQTVVYHGTV